MNRSKMSAKDRAVRSRLAKLVTSKPLIHATLNVRHLTCGNPGCKCARGEKHRALYLLCNVAGKKRQVYVPGKLEQEVRGWVENHHAALELIEEVSEQAWGELLRRKEEKDF